MAACPLCRFPVFPAAYAELQAQADEEDISQQLNNSVPHFGEDTDSELSGEADDSTSDYEY
ncbi:hypothetical protein PF004_g16567 [Phytophthora fragariae]|uniref:Uncharacterized protein n=1 Tax=Phytophthora fragariae TaxID=53985 RepID=A0A6A3JM94_9STRA|nr:hypothetical protein PF011_g16443 [Phytophthora fragariae]KAE9209108.1 hypothetical protein PF004_g16567 [Phytophthora fragariae]